MNTPFIDWAIATFGEAEMTNVEKRFNRLFEEVAELGLAIGFRKDQLAGNLLSILARQEEGGDPQGEVADVGLTFDALTWAMGADLEALKAKRMERNLARSQSYYDRKQADNVARGL